MMAQQRLPISMRAQTRLRVQAPARVVRDLSMIIETRAGVIT